MSIGTTVIELREFKKKKKKNMEKICLALIGRGSGILVKYNIFHTQFCFDMFYTV